MYAASLKLFFPVFNQGGVAKKKQDLQQSRQQELNPDQERLALINRLCESRGMDSLALKRYFALTRIL